MTDLSIPHSLKATPHDREKQLQNQVSGALGPLCMCSAQVSCSPTDLLTPGSISGPQATVQAYPQGKAKSFWKMLFLTFHSFHSSNSTSMQS